MDHPIYLRNIPPPDEYFDHTFFINYMAKWIQPNIYLELGVRNSPVLKSMSFLANKCIGVDTNISTFQKKLCKDDVVELYEMTTDDFFDNIMSQNNKNNIKFDMVFIDADHSHQSSMKDFDNVFPYVNDDGFIFLHDTYPIHESYLDPNKCGDSYKTAWYIRQNYADKCEILTIPVQPGLSIVRKSKSQLLWN